MSITSLVFLFIFLPISLVIYYISDDKAKEYVLLFVSLIFYAIGSVEYVVIFIASIFCTVLLGRIIAGIRSIMARRVLLIAGIILNVSLLFYFKYFNFSLKILGQITARDIQMKEILLPLGISFYTFKSISYLADVYCGKVILESNPIHDALYLSIFSQIQSGPITRYGDLKGAMTVVNHENAGFKIGGGTEYRVFTDGVFRFLIGFNKKVLIANVLANITSEVFAAPFDNFSTAYAWLGSICYSLQLYYDFAGYSDMAIGITEMFGYRCIENFNFPYLTESVTKFWRRWHISLGAWFRDYVYIPLGGSRCRSKYRVYVNLFVVWVLTGIWHGAAWNFVFWGLGYFVVIAFERMTGLPEKLKTKVGRVLYRIVSLLFINFQWVVFNSDGLRKGLRYIKRMILYTPNSLSDLRARFLIKDYAVFITLALLLCFPVVNGIRNKLSDRKMTVTIYDTLICLLTAAGFIWALSFVVAGQNNPFAYANF